MRGTPHTAMNGRGTLPALVALVVAVSLTPAVATATSGLQAVGGPQRQTAPVAVLGPPPLPQGQLPQAPVAQDDPPQGQPVERIEIRGTESIDRETITFFLSTREGDPFDWNTARQDYRALLNTRFFDDLVMRWEPVAEPRDEGPVVLIIEVRERPVLRRIRIEGTDKVEVDDLKERMELLEMEIQEDEPIDRERLRVAQEILTDMLQGDEGLNFVQVEYELVEAAEGAGVDALFSVVEGDEVRIQMVDFQGATVFSQREMRRMMSSTGEHWLGSLLTKNDRFSPAGFERDMIQLSQEYRRRGYLDFTWGEPRVDVHEVDRTLFLDPVERLFVTVPIEEGPQYHLGQLSFEGNEEFTDNDLQALFPLQEGDVLNVQALLDTQEAIKSLYQTSGYLQVFVGIDAPRTPDAGMADVTFSIEENDKYTVRRIEFEGNSSTRDYVLRRNLRLNEQETWNYAAFQRSRFKIMQLGYFDNVEPELSISDEVVDPQLPGSRPDQQQVQQVSVDEDGDGPGPGEVDIKLKLTEVGRNQVSFGGGVSALEGGFVQFGYTTRNLFGRGQTLSFYGQFGGRRTNARVSFHQPYLLGKPIRFGFDLFRDSLDYFNFQRQGTGVSTRVGFPLDDNEFLNFYTEYNYEFIDIGDIDDSFLGVTSPLYAALFLEEGQRTTSSVRPFLRWNDIDNPYNPTRGREILLSLEGAGGPLGGTLDFWKARATTTWYQPTVWDGRGVNASVRQLFATNVEVTYAGTHGDLEELPIFERFFLGGSNSVRGTRLRAIGPVDEFGNIIGGDRALQYNLEYILQLADPLRLAIFQDAGGAWAPGDSLDLRDMRPTAGVEFRVFAPVFNVPFRFFWAYNFDPRQQFGEERSTFEFAIGNTF